MKGLHAVLCSALLLTGAKFGSAAEKPVWSVKAEVLMVAVKPSTALTLIPELQAESSVDAAFNKLKGMMEREEAEILGWPIITARSGQRAIAETVEEVRYPVEIEVGGPQAFAKAVAPPVEKPMQNLTRRVWRSWGAITPTAFGTQNTGPTLEVEPVVEGDGTQISLALVARYVRFAKFHEWHRGKNLVGTEGAVAQPEFIHAVFTGILTARNGRWMLLSSFVEQQPQPRMVLFLLRASSSPGTTKQPTQ